MDFRLEGFLGRIDERFEGSRIVDGHFAKHLAIEAVAGFVDDARFVEAVDEFAVA